MDKKFALRTAGSREYSIQGLCYIGRDVDCLIRYDDPAVSPHHARVWVAQGGLCLTDENSLNGVLINGWKINPSQVYQLQPGDRVRLGNTNIELEVVGQTNLARRLSPVVILGMFGCLLVLGLGFLTSAYFIFGRNVPGKGSNKAQVLAAFTPESLLKPQEYAASGLALVQAVAALNQSEMDFIQAASGTTSISPTFALVGLMRPAPMPDPLDEKLIQIAADAMRVAATADSLSKTAAAQGGGSAQAGQVAGQYGSIAQLGASLVIDAQDLRSGLAQGSITKQQAAASVAEYGARLWNPSVTSPEGTGNPFSPYLPAQTSIPVSRPISSDNLAQLSQQIGNGLSSWVAVSSETTTKKFNIPYSNLPADNLNDPALQAKMSTSAGQADGNAAKQAAVAIIKGEGGSVSSNDQAGIDAFQVSYSSAMAVSSPLDVTNVGSTLPANLPAFPKGSATIISQTSANDIVSNLITLDSGNDPIETAEIPVVETKPLVTLEISNINIETLNQRPKDANSSFEADVTYSFDVKWSTNLVAPHFSLDCVGNNQVGVSSTHGSQHLTAKSALILYPGTVDVYCYATNLGSNWGNADVRFLVGDSAAATQRANQVETDSANLNLELTVDSQGTLDAQATDAAATLAELAVENAVSTEVAGTQTAEFRATITEIARRTLQAPPPQDTETPLPTATFTPVLVDTFFHPGDVFAVSGKYRMQRGHLYRICLSGTVYLTTGPARPSDLDHINGVAVPLSGCMVLEGDGSVVTASCGHGVPAPDPGGFNIQVFDLGPD